MKYMVTTFFFAFAALFTATGDEVPTNAPPHKVVGAAKEVRIWISSFAPISVRTEERGWPPIGGYATPEIPPDIYRQWRTNYTVFRQLLISTAQKASLDSAALAKALPEFDVQKKSKVVALLPVQAHFAEVKGEMAWVVTYYWEYVDSAPDGGLGHIMAEAFAQKTLKLVWGSQCD